MAVKWCIPAWLKSAILLLAVWAAVSMSGILNPFLFPSPDKVGGALFSLIASQATYTDLASTLGKIALALFIGSAIGLAIGILLQLSDGAFEIASPLIDFFRSIPATALFPLFIIIFGVGDATNTALATWICALYVAFYSAQGLRNTPEGIVDFAKSLRKKWHEILLFVRLPAAMPTIFLGMRTAASLAVVVVILSEMFVGTSSGLGKLMIDSAYTYEIARLYALILLVGATGFCINLAMETAEAKFIHWKTQ